MASPVQIKIAERIFHDGKKIIYFLCFVTLLEASIKIAFDIGDFTWVFCKWLWMGRDGSMQIDLKMGC